MRAGALIDAGPALAAATTVAVIVHWRGADDTRRCVASLRAHAADTPVVIIDNASTDGSAAALHVAFGDEPFVRIERAASNGGFGAGANVGIGIALGVGLVSGIVPGLRASRLSAVQALREVG